MTLTEYPDREIMMMDLADRIASELNLAVAARGKATLAVPGGTTPGPVFDTLCGVDLDWAKITVMLTDERWVPEGSERSNTALLKARLLRERAAAAAFFPFYTGDDTPEAALDGLNAAITPHLPLTVLLLGMGADMHTASLFPGADRLEAALSEDAPPLLAMRAPGAPEPRITLTAPVLAGALATHVVITGADKRAALAEARELDDPRRAPICAVLDGAEVHWAP